MSKKDQTLPIQVLRDCLLYDCETGLIYWKIKPAGTRRVAGDVAGNVDKQRGYVQIRLLGKKMYGHRVAWALHYGEWPNAEVDHINLNKSDNRLNNLRLVTHQQNLWNQPRRPSKVGRKGVYRTKSGFMAQIKHMKKTIYIGHFATEDEASDAYEKKASELRGAFSQPTSSAPEA